MRRRLFAVCLLFLVTAAQAQTPIEQIEALFRQGQYQETERLLREALSLTEGAESAPYCMLMGDFLSGSTEPLQALDFYEKAVKRHTDPEKSAEAFLRGSYLLLNVGQKKRAQECFAKVYDRYPDTLAGVRSLEGLSGSLVAEDPGRASELLKKAYAIWKSKSSAKDLAHNLEQQALLSIARQNFDLAIEQAKEAVASWESPEALLVLGQAHHGKLDLASAKLAYQRALRSSREKYGDKDPTTYIIASGYALCLTGSGEYAEAVQLYEQIPSSQLPSKHIFLSQLYTDLGWGQKAYDEARLALKAAKAKLPETLPTARYACALTALDLGRYEEADEQLREYDKLNDVNLRSQAVVLRARLYRYRGELDKAAQVLQEHLPAASPRNRVSMLLQLGRLYGGKGEYGLADSVLEQCRKEAELEYGPENQLLAGALLELGGARAMRNQPEQSLASTEEALRMNRVLFGGKNLRVAESLTTASYTYIILAEFERAKAALSEAHSIYRQKLGEQHSTTLRAQAQLHFLLIQEGDPHSSQVLETILEQADDDDYLTMEICLRLALKYLNQEEKARDFLRRGLPHASGHYKTAYLVLWIQIENSAKNYSKAAELAQELLELSPDPLNRSIALCALGLHHSHKGEDEKAIGYYRQVLENGENLSIPAPMILSHWRMAEHYLNERQPERAYEHLKTALSLDEQSVEVRVDLSTLEKLHATLVETLLYLKRPEEAVERADDSLARSLKETISKKTAGQLAGIPPSELESLRGIESRLKAIQNQLQHSDPLQKGRRARTKVLLAEEASLTEERAETLKTLAARYPRYIELLKPTPLNLASAQEQLKENETLLFYYLGARSFLFLINKDGLTYTEIASNSVLNPLAQEYNKALGAGTKLPRAKLIGAVQNPDSAKLEELRQELWRHLIKPLQAYDQDILKSSLVVVPTQNLWMVPLESLPDFQGEGFLLQSRSVSYSPSISLFARLRLFEDSAKRGGRPLLFGAADYGSRFPALPFAEKELTELAAQLPESRLYSKSQAVESAYLENPETQTAPVIHFATHGVLGKNPALILTPDSKSDGRLSMDEIFSRKIGARLVTLSACSTGRGWVKSGEGVVGLSRAFLHSGASSVLVSLWNVNDRSTAELMVDFYHKFPERDLVQALRQAKLKLIENGASVNQWAPFVLIGAP